MFSYELDTFSNIILIISLSALLYALYIVYIESTQPPIIFKLRNDLKKIKIDLVNMENPEKELNDPDVLQLINRLNPDYLYTSDSTYTINKKYIYVCTKLDSNFSYEENYKIILFTILHEVGHIMTPSIGHDQNFWQNFGVLINHAKTLGLYDTPMEQILENRDYNHCGLTIDKTYSPFS